MPALSVIVTTYNQPAWLEKCLLGFACQDVREFELIVADDGSGPQTRQCIEALRTHLPFPLQHLWQEDAGFRKCRALNLGILAARSDYLVFTDGDCIPRADFLSQHLRRREPRRFLSGGYCKLPMHTSEQIGTEQIRSGQFADPRWLRAHGLRRRTLKLWARPGWSERLLNTLTPTRPRWHGHNASAWKDDLLRVNGFDERMQYGGEDLELGDRLEHAGVRGKQIRFSAICVHLDHPRGYVREDMRIANEQIRAQTRRERAVWTEHGLSGHLP